MVSVISDDLNSRVLHLLRTRALVQGVEVKLASGKPSNFYIDCKRISLHGPSLALVSQAFFEMLKVDAPSHVAGVSVGGDPLVAGVIIEAARESLEWGGLLVRKEKKAHGMSQGRAVDGVLGKETRSVWLVEDVVSTGGSSLTAARHLLEEGYPLRGIVCLVDREMGGPEMLKKELGLPVHALFRVSEVLAGT
jgi:orotate phosphoribosyltransferase